MIYELFFRNHGEPWRRLDVHCHCTRRQYQTDEEEVSCYAIGSGHSISSNTEVDIDPLINLDLDKGAAINRKSLFQITAFAKSYLFSFYFLCTCILVLV